MAICAVGKIAAAGNMGSCKANGLMRASLVSSARASCSSIHDAKVCVAMTLYTPMRVIVLPRRIHRPLWRRPGVAGADGGAPAADGARRPGACCCAALTTAVFAAVLGSALVGVRAAFLTASPAKRTKCLAASNSWSSRLSPSSSRPKTRPAVEASCPPIWAPFSPPRSRPALSRRLAAPV